MKPKQKRYFFQLHISQEQFLRHYQGHSNAVQVLSECGRKIRFPASRLRPHLRHDGIHGRYCLTVDSRNRFVSITPVP
jgi:hypothetical protein